MTKERIAELRVLCEAATPEPWRDDGMMFVDIGPEQYPEERSLIDCQLATNADRRFVAAARTALPEALDEIERLEAEAEQIATWLAAHGTTPEQVRDAMRWSLEDREMLQAENAELRLNLDLALAREAALPNKQAVFTSGSNTETERERVRRLNTELWPGD
jgi:hypothetical protein